jgi:Serine dehydrogenase proteinase
MKNVYSAIHSEMGQLPQTRKKLFLNIERAPELQGRSLVTFCTSFNHPVQIEDSDCDALESLLQKLDLSKGLVLLISSPGGNGLSAERIVNICRTYSGTKDYWALVPGKAKSAGTIVCMGASKILMGGSSELGPVDPQIFPIEDGKRKAFSLHNLVESYDTLFKEAVASTGRLEPYLQQLAHFDYRDIVTYRSLIQLANDIAKKVLRSGMLKGKDDATIEKDIEVFLNPSAGTLSHGRPIFMSEALGCGLNCEPVDVKGSLWQGIYELYVRTNVYVSTAAAKAIECKQEAFHAPAPK